MDRGHARIDRRGLFRHIGIGLVALHGASRLRGEPSLRSGPELSGQAGGGREQTF